MGKSSSHQNGFTLIELSIVLVIIGLIVGGVLVGQNLIAAAGVRATISQIEKYNTAVNTFREKYGALPGDLNQSVATQFGFTARGTIAGSGDGNGVIEGNQGGAGTNSGSLETRGETTLFWVDLSQMGLIEGTFNSASATGSPGNMTLSTNPGPVQFFPQAKIGRGNFVEVWSGGPSGGDGNNYFGVSVVQTMGSGGSLGAYPGLMVQEAYSIDSKVDDGMPQSGNVMAVYAAGCLGPTWAAGGATTPACPQSGYAGAGNTPYTGSTPFSITNCYDNNNVSGPETYSVAKNAGVVNCALSFRFQ
jgi:prepilin-type N-terminal cleavage/methylation domain-containing protein